MDEHDQDPELEAAIAAHPAGGSDPDQGPTPELDEWGIPTLGEFELEALHSAIAKARQNLAVNRLNYFLLARVGGIPGQQPEQIRKDLPKLRAQLELLEGFARDGGMPDEPGLEVPESPELVVAGAGRAEIEAARRELARAHEGAGADS